LIIKEGLNKHNIEFTEEEFSDLIQLLKFKDNQTDEISRVERYANGHLF